MQDLLDIAGLIDPLAASCLLAGVVAFFIGEAYPRLAALIIGAAAAALLAGML